MAKGQLRSNRETKKPKADKKPTAAATNQPPARPAPAKPAK